MSNEAVRQVLIDARNLIEEKGWIRGNLKSEEGYCASGAIAEAAGMLEPGDYYGEWKVNWCAPGARIGVDANRSLEKAESHAGRPVSIYNDLHLTSKQEVLEWFTEAIASLE